MFFYHFLQLCPQGHISKMLAVTVIENTVNNPANTVMSNEHQIDILPRILEYQFFLKRTSI